MGAQQSTSLCPSGGLYQIFTTGAKHARNSFYRSSSELSFGLEVPYFETMCFVTENLFKALRDKKQEQKSKIIDDCLFYSGKQMTIENCLKVCPPPNFKIFVLALIFCKRVTESENLEIQKINFTRLLMISIITAIKYQAPSEKIQSNQHYAKILDVYEIQLRAMELQFMKLLNNQLYVHKIEISYIQQQILDFVDTYKIQIDSEEENYE